MLLFWLASDEPFRLVFAHLIHQSFANFIVRRSTCTLNSMEAFLDANTLLPIAHKIITKPMGTTGTEQTFIVSWLSGMRAIEKNWMVDPTFSVSLYWHCMIESNSTVWPEHQLTQMQTQTSDPTICKNLLFINWYHTRIQKPLCDLTTDQF